MKELSYKKDCFAFRKNSCFALKARRCSDCKFYKTEEEEQISRKKAEKSLEKLPEVTREYYRNKYHIQPNGYQKKILNEVTKILKDYPYLSYEEATEKAKEVISDEVRRSN